MNDGREEAMGKWGREGSREQGEGVRNRLCEGGWEREKGGRVEEGNA